MRLILILLISLIKTSFAFACCSAGQYKLYPLGYQQEKLIVAEFQMSRYCINGSGTGEKNEFHWDVVVNLSYIFADTAVLIENIDSISFKECSCDYRNLDEKSEILTRLFPTYRQALKKASNLKGFKKVIPEIYKSITEKDTLSNYKFIETDTTSKFYYKGKYKELHSVNWAPCGFLNSVQEIRKYRFGEKLIVIVNLSCYPIEALPKEKLTSNKQNFKLLKKALIYTPTQWHGKSKDYILEY